MGIRDFADAHKPAHAVIILLVFNENCFITWILNLCYIFWFDTIINKDIDTVEMPKIETAMVIINKRNTNSNFYVVLFFTVNCFALSGLTMHYQISNLFTILGYLSILISRDGLAVWLMAAETEDRGFKRSDFRNSCAQSDLKLTTTFMVKQTSCENLRSLLRNSMMCVKFPIRIGLRVNHGLSRWLAYLIGFNRIYF